MGVFDNAKKFLPEYADWTLCFMMVYSCRISMRKTPLRKINRETKRRD